MIRIGVGVLQALPPARLIELVRWLDASGVRTLWYANEKFFRDPFVGLTLAAIHSKRLRLATFVADPYTVHPVVTAIAAATLDELSSGRAVLTFGVGGTGLDRLRIERRRPVAALRDAVAISRAVFSGNPVVFDGPVFSVDRVSLGFPVRSDIPVFIASRGDQVLALAGECADGVMIATYATPRGVGHALSRVAIGAQRTGRDVRSLTTVSRVDGWIADDRSTARDALRPMVARLLSASYPDRSFVRASGVAVPRELDAITARRDRAAAGEAGQLVSDELLDAFVWAGTPADVAEQVAAVAELGIDEVTFMPHPPPGVPVELGLRRFVEEVVPRVRSLGVEVELTNA